MTIKGRKVATTFDGVETTAGDLDQLQTQTDGLLHRKVAATIGWEFIKFRRVAILSCNKSQFVVTVTLLLLGESLELERCRDLEILLKTRLVGTDLYPDVMFMYCSGEEAHVKRKIDELENLFADGMPLAPIAGVNVSVDQVKEMLAQWGLRHLRDHVL